MKKKKPSKKGKTAWPTKKVMQQIYENHLWGGEASEFYSGEGSHVSEFVIPYVTAVSSFLNAFKTPLQVCDLGCGDFNVGDKLLPYTAAYIAVDIVPELIERNRDLFQYNHLKFQCLNLATDPLPPGDCALIRQVLQHISNAEIYAVVQKLSQYKYVIVTEHIPQGDFVPNLDILSGQGIRLKKQSGVNLLAAPFNMTVKKAKVLLQMPLKANKELIVTTLYEMH